MIIQVKIQISVLISSRKLHRVNVFGIRVGITGRHKDKLKNFQGLVLPSHKGWADFFVTSQLDFSAPLARLSTGLILPAIFPAAKHGDSVLLVHRRRGTGIKATKEQIEEKNNRLADQFDDFVRNRNPRLLIYPEGSRYSERGILPFRSGLFRIAFKKNLKLLVCPCEGSQYIVREKELFIHPANVKIPSSRITPDITSVGPVKEGDPCRGYILFNICDVIDPSDFPSFEEFKAEAERSFTAGYNDCGADQMSIQSKILQYCLGKQTFLLSTAATELNISEDEFESEITKLILSHEIDAHIDDMAKTVTIHTDPKLVVPDDKDLTMEQWSYLGSQLKQWKQDINSVVVYGDSHPSH
ncbi:hypothetical protein BLNAU_2493 [Blattamonas nauphoetae]|uniref:Phospholipid/glycerol acyltransferase domain-containing protein n=1 Tax=Blattamonas nauphoetae TaxID=2049346 RepID=A0ABQ9YG70_9EUKA|nr:hypothetical protein BLNAU_2493 [Blattamonas nauphoetae]